jgi:hypothetical protein
MIWNDENQTASIIAQEEFFASDRVNNHINIFFNRSLYSKFTSFPASKDYNLSLGRIYCLLLKSYYGTNIVSLDTQLTGVFKNYIKYDQEYSTISNWSVVSAIVFTSSNLPVVATQISDAVNYVNGMIVSKNSGRVTEPIITDMTSNDMCYKPNLLYVPSAQYRMIDLFGSSDIQNVDISVYWKNRYTGELNPFYLQSSGSCSLKLLFQLKK